MILVASVSGTNGEVLSVLVHGKLILTTVSYSSGLLGYIGRYTVN